MGCIFRFGVIYATSRRFYSDLNICTSTKEDPAKLTRVFESPALLFTKRRPAIEQMVLHRLLVSAFVVIVMLKAENRTHQVHI